MFPIPPFSLILLNLEGNRFRKRKGVKLWIERLIKNSAEELSFRGIWFQFHYRCDFEKSHFEQVFVEHLLCYTPWGTVVRWVREQLYTRVTHFLRKHKDPEMKVFLVRVRKSSTSVTRAERREWEKVRSNNLSICFNALVTLSLITASQLFIYLFIYLLIYVFLGCASWLVRS